MARYYLIVALILLSACSFTEMAQHFSRGQYFPYNPQDKDTSSPAEYSAKEPAVAVYQTLAMYNGISYEEAPYYMGSPQFDRKPMRTSLRPIP